MKFLISSLVLVSLFAVAGETQTVYRRVDEHGTVSFSDTPPAQGELAEPLVLRIPQSQSADEYRQNLEDMRETTDRMAADRRAREQHRAELREIEARAEAARQAAAQPPVQQHDDGWYFSTGGYYYRPGWRPGYRPHPVHPIAPVQPPLDLEAWSRTHNSQLMRPILPRPTKKP